MARQWWREREAVRKMIAPLRGGEYLTLARRHQPYEGPPIVYLDSHGNPSPPRLPAPMLLSSDPSEDTRHIPPRLAHPPSYYIKSLLIQRASCKP